MSHEMKASLAAIPHYDYGDPPEKGESYWAEQEGSPIPGRGVDLIHSQYAETAREIDARSKDHRNAPIDNVAVLDNIESKFLDELYGTDRDPSTDGAVAAGEDTTTWGLDLRRTRLNEDFDIRSEEFYEHQTKGEVDWAHYKDSPRYQAAFQKLGYDINSLGTDIPQSIQAIRHANVGLGSDVYGKKFYDPGSWKRDWEGKYDEDHIVKQGKDLYRDGVRQETLSEKYAQGQGRLQIDHDFTPLTKVDTKQTEVVRPNLNINKVSVKRPANIPASWGKA